MCIHCFLSILVWAIKIHKILGNVQWKVVKQLKNSDFQSIYHNATVTVNLFEILEMLPGICLTCAIKCFPSILVWAMQIHQHFYAMFSGRLLNN